MFSQDKAGSQIGTDILKVIIGIILGGGILKYIQYFRQKKDIRLKRIAEHEADREFENDEWFKKNRKAKEIYCAALKDELGFIFTLNLCQALELEENLRSPSRSVNTNSVRVISIKP